jgi:hypothetical protein
VIQGLSNTIPIPLSHSPSIRGHTVSPRYDDTTRLIYQLSLTRLSSIRMRVESRRSEAYHSIQHIYSEIVSNLTFSLTTMLDIQSLREIVFSENERIFSTILLQVPLRVSLFLHSSILHIARIYYSHSCHEDDTVSDLYLRISLRPLSVSRKISPYSLYLIAQIIRSSLGSYTRCSERVSEHVAIPAILIYVLLLELRVRSIS